jgi:uncharacterized protein (TIGR00369 family)
MIHPFHAHTGLTIESAADGKARLRMKWRPEHAQGYGGLQGGYLAILADAAVHTAADTLARPGEVMTTVELKTNFLAPVRGQDVVAEATIVKRGRTLVLGDVNLRTDGGELVGKSLVTYMVLQPRTAPAAKG